MATAGVSTPTKTPVAPHAASPPGLPTAGLAKGDKVVFWGENRPEWVVCYWGCLLAGVVVVPIDYRSSADFVAKVSDLVDARVLLVGDDVEEEVSRRLSARLAIRRPRLECRRPDARRADFARRRDSDHLHVRRHRRSQGRRHSPSKRAGEHRPGRTRGDEVSGSTPGPFTRSGS